ncbi:MAG TPA: 3-phosphoshikimate 1-carboxyvinyltransferase [Nitrososphaerales archaeon]|nr:3-phosphoshikimate 1-carboxyvinyltransferase [Nitrososphaerales archaeon]
MEPRTRLEARGKLRGKVAVPPSKSYTHRAVVMASLSEGTSRVSNPLISRDTLATVRACRAMGAKVEEDAGLVRVVGAEPAAPDDVVNVDNSGTTLRFMTSVFSLAERGYTVLTGDVSTRRRPMQGLLDALVALGGKARSAKGDGCAPIIVGEGGLTGGEAEVRGDVSSQFVSSILIASPLVKRDSTLRVVDAVSRPYIEATMRLSELHEIEVHRDGYSKFDIPGSQKYRACDFVVPGDFSSASFLMAAVALVGGEVELSGLTTTLPQGDVAILDMLRRMGVEVNAGQSSVVVAADGERLKGGRFDLSDTPDLLPVLSVLSLKCDSPVEIAGVAHARYKETDRINVAATELSKIGVDVEERRDGMKISRPGKLTKGVLDAHNDHRMFMAFSLASILSHGEVEVLGEKSLDVSYPSFLGDMDKLGARVVRA